MIIRQETQADHEKVYQLIQEAFVTAEHADGTEQDLVVALRKSEAFLPTLSLVAEIDGEIIGHILFTKGMVGSSTVLMLAPLSVAPSFWRQGVGTALIAAGHQEGKALGYSYSLVLGSELYYPRMGYRPAEEFGILMPKDFPRQNFMAIQLREDAPAISGAVTYAKEFGL